MILHSFAVEWEVEYLNEHLSSTFVLIFSISNEKRYRIVAH